jgi:hypothetical protein
LILRRILDPNIRGFVNARWRELDGLARHGTATFRTAPAVRRAAREWPYSEMKIRTLSRSDAHFRNGK